MLFKKIEEELRAAAGKVCPDWKGAELFVRKCPIPRFGDYQCSFIMALAKQSGGNARKIAADIASQMSAVPSVCEKVEAAGPGFLNFRIRREALETCLNQKESAPCFVEKERRPQTFLIDFSSPNVAKPMHVGHIRSTNLGDCISRILRFWGHRVITDNHIGDWGTQFGKLLFGWKSDLNEGALRKDALGEMERLYRKVNQDGETRPEILRQARRELLALQQGDQESQAIWQRMIELSRRQFDEVYARLNVRFDETLGESHYNQRDRKSVV